MPLNSAALWDTALAHLSLADTVADLAVYGLLAGVAALAMSGSDVATDADDVADDVAEAAADAVGAAAEAVGAAVEAAAGGEASQ